MKYSGKRDFATECATSRLRCSVRELRKLARRVPACGWTCQLGRVEAGPGVLASLWWSIGRSDCRALKTVALTACSSVPPEPPLHRRPNSRRRRMRRVQRRLRRRRVVRSRHHRRQVFPEASEMGAVPTANAEKEKTLDCEVTVEFQHLPTGRCISVSVPLCDSGRGIAKRFGLTKRSTA